MSIEIAKTAGFCVGVERAVNLAMKECEKGETVYTLGQLIHNAAVNEKLRALGAVCVESTDEVPENAKVIIRAHGVGRNVYEELEKKNARIIDATCGFVKKIHRIVEQESLDGRLIIVMGNASHPEVMGIVGWSGECLVMENVEDMEKFLSKNDINGHTPLSIVAQTTSNVGKWEKFIKFTKKQCTNAKIFDTICSATDERQKEARKLASESDVSIVVGDRGSSNTMKLVDICRQECERVYLVSSADELCGIEFSQEQKIGVTAGASAPGWLIKEVVNKMSEEIKKGIVEDTNEAMSFEELLEQSVKTLYTGDRVTGIVTQITPSEVQVDLGVKHAAYIPVSELSDDPLYKIDENIKVGQEIDAFVVRVNDGDGNVLLSKKRIESMKGMDDVQKAFDEKTTVEGKVTDVVKGGIIAVVNGVRVFIPSSQVSNKFVDDLNSFKGQTLEFNIIELDKSKRRIIGGRKALIEKEAAEKKEALFASIEAGKKVTGTVSRITDFGAFVNLGGIDGLIHISEMSWGRITNPREFLKEGDSVEVMVLDADKEKGKISLSLKDVTPNPWAAADEKYAVGTVVEGKVVRMVPFGAFVELEAGVDGLVHISQISEERIEKPEDKLTIGEVIKVKVLEVNAETKKISLSKKQAEAPAEEAAETEAE